MFNFKLQNTRNEFLFMMNSAAGYLEMKLLISNGKKTSSKPCCHLLVLKELPQLRTGHLDLL